MAYGSPPPESGGGGASPQKIIFVAAFSDRAGYQAGCSTDLCMAIGLHRVEETDEICLNTDFDCKKAFDSAFWKTIIQKMEEKTGSGKFFSKLPY